MFWKGFSLGIPAFLIGVIVAVVAIAVMHYCRIAYERGTWAAAMVAISGFYVAFAFEQGAGQVEHTLIAAVFTLLAIVGARFNAWFIVAALLGHGVFDAGAQLVAPDPSPDWWGPFCVGVDIVLELWLLILILGNRLPVVRHNVPRGRMSGADAATHGHLGARIRRYWEPSRAGSPFAVQGKRRNHMSDTTSGARAQHHNRSSKSSEHGMSGSSYGRFLAMVGTSTALMFGLMYLNTYSIEHLYWSETRFYMTFVMGAVMAVVMLLFMWGMYRSKAANAAIIVGSVVLFAGALWLVRSQTTVQDRAWMSAMIPHHSIAIMTSERANITDPRVETLATEIVHAQNREISEMRFLLDDIAARGEVTDWPLGEPTGPAPVEGLQQAIASPVIASIRPAPMTAEDIERALGQPALCTFTRAVNADPVLATAADGTAVASLSEALVLFDGTATPAGGTVTAEGGQMTVTPGTGADGEDATLIFELTGDRPLRVGFTGYWTCNS